MYIYCIYVYMYRAFLVGVCWMNLFISIHFHYLGLKIAVRGHDIKRNQINPSHKCVVSPSQDRPCQTGVGNNQFPLDMDDFQGPTMSSC